MNEKDLFEIPIYSMTEKEFDNRWSKKKYALYNNFIECGHSDDSIIKQIIKFLCFPRNIFKYNQIIGFIKISVSKQDVLFYIYLSNKKHYFANSKTKNFIVDTGTLGIHFYVGNKSNKEIKEEINFWLKEIEQNHIKKRFFIDYSTFKNTIDYIDIKKIIESI